jgi:hypothetical protein
MRGIRRIRVVLSGDDFTGELSEAGERFRNHEIIPSIGASIPLPDRLVVARSKPEDVKGYTTESVEIDIPEIIGTVTGVSFGLDDEVHVYVEPFKGRKHTRGP